MLTAHRTTLDEFMALPEDERTFEFVRGELIEMPPPKISHGLMEHALSAAIDRYLYGRALALGWSEDRGNAALGLLVGRVAVGDAGVRLNLPHDQDQIRGLDIAYFSAEQMSRLASVLAEEYATEMPVLAAEIISESETAAYIEEKVADYIAGGARLIWLVFPRTRTVKAITPDGVSRTMSEGDRLDGGDVLPGFSLQISSLFS